MTSWSGLLLVLALAVFPGVARAERPAMVAVDDVRVRAGGRHTLVVSVLDAAGTPVNGLENAFRVTLDGAPVDALEARAGRDVSPQATVTLVVDAAILADVSPAGWTSALRDLSSRLAPGDGVRLVSAGTRVRTREFTASAAERLGDALRGARESEAPHLYDALVDAVRAAARLPERRGVVVLALTRGADGDSRHGSIDVLALARAGGRLTPVEVVLLGDRGAAPESERLRRLAATTGGAVAEITSTDGVGPVLGDLARRGLDRWRVTFRATKWDAKAPRHRVRVAIEHEGARRSTETEYVTADALPASAWRRPLPWLLLGLGAVIALAAWIFGRRRQLGLLVHDGDDWDGVWYDLFGFPISVGGAAGNDLVLGQGQVSRHHAVLERRGRTVELADLNSENGTFVNGERVTRRVLADGDRISFGPAVHVVYEARG